jgi:REP element-mobilizing transposase RayT
MPYCSNSIALKYITYFLHDQLSRQVSTKRPICKTVEIIKSISSKKFKKLSGSDWHGWQNGYFISSVGRSTKSKIKKYLDEQ